MELNEEYMEGIFMKKIFVKHSVAEIPNYITLYDNFTSEKATHHKKPMNEYLKTPSFMFFFIRKGSVSIDVNGQMLNTSAQFAVTMTKNQAYSVKEVSDDYQYFAIEIDDSIIDEAKIDLDINFGLLHIEKQGCIVDHLSENMFNYLEHLYFNMLYWAKKAEHPYKHLILKHFANIILIEKVNDLNNYNDEQIADNKTAISRQHVIFQNFIKLLEQHADKHRDVKFYASELGVTPKYLSAVTHVYTGKSAISSIEDFVINKVKTIMGERAYSIQQICRLMNFNSQSFFGRYFKRITGMSPREYMLSINLV